MLDNQNDLTELKALLFKEELDSFEKLEKSIALLQSQQYSLEDIRKEIKPHLDDFLDERLAHKDRRTVEIYSKYFCEILTNTIAKDKSSMSKALQPVISPVITQEIEENKDKMIDALYPIMGGMIAKYVTQAIKEMMESINKKIESGLSFEHYKRKFKVKFTGVSEAELLLQESSSPMISSLLVIHKKSSFLIAQAHLEDKEIDDAHMVASMASAIKDFINDWMKNNELHNEIQILSYRNATLYIESAGSVYMIAFLDSEPNYEQRNEINTFFSHILNEYMSFFQTFSGDDSADEVVTLSMKMEDYLYKQKSAMPTQKNPIMHYIWGVIIALCFGYLGYVLNNMYVTYTLENTIYKQTGETIKIESEDKAYVLIGQVSSIDRIYEIEKILKRYTNKAFSNRLLVPMEYLDQRIKDKKTTEHFSQIELEKRIKKIEDNFKMKVDTLEKEIITLHQKLERSKRDIQSVRKQEE